MLSVLLFALTASPADTVPLFPNLGSFSRTISTGVPAAQRYFDQGLRLTYGFNHAEAIRAFDEAARRDPRCAICHWGAAYALGPNINAPMDEAVEARAVAAVGRARQLAAHAAPVERDLIEALAQRYGPPGGGRAARDSAWARAVAELAARYPADDDVLTLAADAAMNLRPWNYWTEAGQPQEGTDRLLGWLQVVVERTPAHPGACHLYIHAVEAAYPERAVPCAERLAALMPGAGHLVHMPAHVYIRVGRYADAVATNHAAVHADETYIGAERPSGVYPSAYYPHNYHFLAFAATMAGVSGEAIPAGRSASERVPAEVAAVVPWLQPILAYHLLVQQVFGRWEAILAAPVSEGPLPAATALTQFARGMAFANTGRMADAQATAGWLRRLLPQVEDPQLRTAVEIGWHVLMGEIEAVNGRHPSAISHFRQAVGLEDGMVYNEPPIWHQPVRHLFGPLLLEAGDAAGAERLYREDLVRFPENGWSLFGLAQALRAQGKIAEAAAVEARFREAWKAADVTLARSRF
jgi:tetratricopeptide (TPR) repeat protein